MRVPSSRTIPRTAGATLPQLVRGNPPQPAARQPWSRWTVGPWLCAPGVSPGVALSQLRHSSRQPWRTPMATGPTTPSYGGGTSRVHSPEVRSTGARAGPKGLEIGTIVLGPIALTPPAPGLRGTALSLDSDRLTSHAGPAIPVILRCG